MKQFKGKAIYTPAGKAAEYARWACNFYVGCSNECEYCYLKKGIGKAVLGGNEPALKKCFRDDEHAIEVFEKELFQNLKELKEHGLFFSFTTDPMLDETMASTLIAMKLCLDNGINVKVLTKNAENSVCPFVGIRGITSGGDAMLNYLQEHRKMIAIGFTLTGHDELEPNASTNAERIEAMVQLHEAGYKTFASIEPVIDVDASLEMIYKTQTICDFFAVGLLSGAKYDKGDVYSLISTLSQYAMSGKSIYIKDSVLKAIGLSRSELPAYFVGSDYNIFNS